MVHPSRTLLAAALLLAQALPLFPSQSVLAACASPGSSGAGGTLSGVIDTYFASPASATVAAGATSIPLSTVRGAKTTVSAGDLLIVMQMQGAVLNTTNTKRYGSGGTGGRGATGVVAGKYEYVVATGSGTSGGSVSIQGAGTGNGTINAYSSAAVTSTSTKFSYQVIVVPQYSTATTGSGLSALPWDGSSGGVLAFDVASRLTLSGTVSVDALGFRGGGGRQLTGPAGTLTGNDYVSSSAQNAHGSKGEGYAGSPRYTYTSGASITDNTSINYPVGDYAQGAPGNAGGGGTDDNPAANDDNSGGGGGSNGGLGGKGGNTYKNNLPTGGVGGDVTPFSASQLFPGGGGGAGTRNNGTAGSAESSGGPGGGMVFVRAGSMTGSGSFTANGGVGVTPTNDGGGGGGAGGSVLLYATSSTATVTLNANGGRGTDAYPANTTAIYHGPGGGGSGGVTVTNASASTSVTGGVNGTTTSDLSIYGAAPGAGGSASSLTATQIPGLQNGDACTPSGTALTLSKQQQNVSTAGTLGTAAISVKPGETIRYLLSASNPTFTTATAVLFRDPLPAELNVPVNGTLTCPDGTTRAVTLSITVTLGKTTISVNVVSSCGQTLNPGQTVKLDFQTTVK